MPRNRSLFLFLALFALGLAASAAFRSNGVLTAKDALVAAAARDASVLDPPLRLTVRATGVVIDAARSLHPAGELFPLVHLAAGILLAFAAAAAGVVAARTAGARPGAATAAAIAVGAGVLFGRDTGFSGVAGGGAAMTLALLSGTALAWSAAKPRAGLGGVLFGLAVVEHPFALLALPGFLAMAVGIELRAPSTEEGGRALRRAGIGFAAGLLALTLPGTEGNGAPLVALASPARWLPQLAELVRTLWHAAGPVGFFAALYGIAALYDGEARLARPFLAIFIAAAFACVLLTSKDADVLAAIASWGFLFFLVPAAAAAARTFEARLGSARAPVALVAAASLAAAALFAWNAGHLDRRAERDIAWVRASFSRISEKSILLTANPAHWALIADGERPDLDVLLVDAPATLAMRRSTLGVFAPRPEKSRTMSAAFVNELIDLNFAHRPIFLDPSLYFDVPRRSEILAEEWQANPFGLAMRVGRKGEPPGEVLRKAAALLWEEYDVSPGTPESPLRGGLSGDAFFARSLLQSAALSIEAELPLEAEREFLLAMTLDEPNPNLAAFGLARILFDRQRYEETIKTLRLRYDGERDGAWLSKKLLGTALLHAGDPAGAVPELEQALRLCPAELVQERQAIGSLLQGAKEGRRLPGRSTQALAGGGARL